MNCCVVLLAIDGFAGVTLIEVSVAAEFTRVKARLWSALPAIATTPERLLTWTGVLLSVVVPLPSWPLLL